MNEGEVSLAVVAYMGLFFGVGLFFIFVNLLVGRFLRPHNPHAEKLEIYECGEPTIGSSFVQFDLRFYVVALLFIIFDVEVAFFFPWATVFGKANHLADLVDSAQANPQVVKVIESNDGKFVLSKDARRLYKEMGVKNPQVPVQGTTKAEKEEAIRAGAKKLSGFTMYDIGVFFAVLMLGFLYVWKRGDLDWVRAVTDDRAQLAAEPPPAVGAEQYVSA